MRDTIKYIVMPAMVWLFSVGLYFYILPKLENQQEKDVAYLIIYPFLVIPMFIIGSELGEKSIKKN